MRRRDRLASSTILPTGALLLTVAIGLAFCGLTRATAKDLDESSIRWHTELYAAHALAAKTKRALFVVFT